MTQAIYGRHPVLEALRSGRSVERLYVLEDAEAKGIICEIKSRARRAGIPCVPVGKQALDRLAGTPHHQGVTAILASREYADPEEVLLKAFSQKEAPLLLVLYQIQDPRNLGSILRTAETAGVHGVFIPKHRGAGLTAGVSKASAGADAYVPVARIGNTAGFLSRLKESGVLVVGLDPLGKQEYTEPDLTGPVALVLGGEEKGLGRLVCNSCDILVRIPMRGRVSSLNVGVAAGIVLFEAVRQRGGTKE